MQLEQNTGALLITLENYQQSQHIDRSRRTWVQMLLGKLVISVMPEKNRKKLRLIASSE